VRKRRIAHVAIFPAAARSRKTGLPFSSPTIVNYSEQISKYQVVVSPKKIGKEEPDKLNVMSPFVVMNHILLQNSNVSTQSGVIISEK
jgi:hypothetical protein